MGARPRLPFNSKNINIIIFTPLLFSVGCGLLLQGGIGHYSRLMGLPADGIVGATLMLLNCEATVVTVTEDSGNQVTLL